MPGLELSRRRAYLRWLASGWLAMYQACRADWPAENCAQYRPQALLNATRWAWDEWRFDRRKVPNRA